MRAQDSPAQKNIASPDSVYHYANQSLDSLQKKFYHGTDSLKKNYAPSARFLQNEIGKLNHKKDSLTNLHMPNSKLVHKIDSLEKVQAKQLQLINTKVENLKKETLGKVQQLQLPPQAQDEVSSFTKNISGYSLPSNFSFSKLPSLNPQMPGFNLPSVPGVPVPSLQQFNIASLQLPSLAQLQSSLDKPIGQLKNISAQANAKAIEQEAKSIAAQNAEVKEVLQEEAQVKGLEKQLGAVKNLKNADSLALAQLKPAVNHFMGKEAELQSAMAQVGKYKQKYSSVKSLAELPKRAPNPLKGKPWYERIVPGLNYFVQRGSYTMVDFNPYVGWRFDPHLTVSLGWNERTGISHWRFHANAYDRVYGLRTSASYLWTRGITFKAAPEVMHAYVPTNGMVDVKHETLVWGLYAGLRKDFPIYKNLKGYSEVMYNFVQQQGKNIYGDPVSFRFGLEASLMKKDKNRPDYKSMAQSRLPRLPRVPKLVRDSLKVFKVKDEKLFGVVNAKNDTLIAPLYQKIKKHSIGNARFFIVEYGNRFGAMTDDLKIAVPLVRTSAHRVKRELGTRSRKQK